MIIFNQQNNNNIMDSLISTTKPYERLWVKRGSKYLENDEFEDITKYCFNYQLISCEDKEKTGSKTPLLCDESLSIILCTESDCSSE